MGVIIENAERDAINEVLYAKNLVLMSVTMEDLKESCWILKEQLENRV